MNLVKFFLKLPQDKAQSSESGLAMLVFAFALVPIIIFVTFAVDLTFLMTQRTFVRKSLDNAVLAAMNYRVRTGWSAVDNDVLLSILKERICIELGAGDEEIKTKDNQLFSCGNVEISNVAYDKQIDEITATAHKTLQLIFSTIVRTLTQVPTAEAIIPTEIIAEGKARLNPIIISLIADNSASMQEPAFSKSVQSKMDVLAASLKEFALRFNPYRDKINLITFNTIANLNIPLARNQYGFKSEDFTNIKVSSEYQTNIAAGLMTAFVDTYNYLYNLAGGANAQLQERPVIGDSVDLVWLLFTDGAPTAGLFNYTNWNYSYWGSPAIDLWANDTIDLVNYNPDPSKIKTTLFNAYTGLVAATYPPENFSIKVENDVQTDRAKAAVGLSPGQYLSTGFLNYKISLTPNSYEQSINPPFGFDKKQRIGRIPVISPIMNPETYRSYLDSGSVGVIPSDATNIKIPCSKAHTGVNLTTDTVDNDNGLFSLVQKLVRRSIARVFGIDNNSIGGETTACLIDDSGVDYIAASNKGCIESPDDNTPYTPSTVNPCIIPAIDFCVPDCTWPGIINKDDGKTYADKIIVEVNQGQGYGNYADTDKDNIALKSYYMLAVAWTEFLRSLIGAKIRGEITIASSRVFTIGLGSAAQLQGPYEQFGWKSFISADASDIYPDAWQDITDDLSRKDIVLVNMANDYAASSDYFVRSAINFAKNVSFGGVKPNFCEELDNQGDLKLSINTNSCGEYYPVRTAGDLNEVFSSIARKIQLSMIN